MTAKGETRINASDARKKTHFVIGTRKSQLAMIQTEHVLKLLQSRFPEFTFSLLPMSTTGDNVLDVALAKIGTKSLFTKELEIALHQGDCDLVVHSLKDMPTVLPEGMTIGAILEREDPRDAVVFKKELLCGDGSLKSLKTLRTGSVVGTSSVRRCAQLKRRFPHLQFQDVRGNLNTRLKKLDAPDSPYSALLLAYAGLARLGWHDRITEILSPDDMLHAVGQGALGVECREGDTQVLEMLNALDHFETRLRCTAERAFMRTLEGGCSVPLGVWTEITCDAHDGNDKDGNGDCGDAEDRDANDNHNSNKQMSVLMLRGTVVSIDGTQEICDTRQKELRGTREEQFSQVAELGVELANVLISKGAKEILDAIKRSAVSVVPAADEKR